MKKILIVLGAVLVLLATYSAWVLLKSQPSFAEQEKFFYIRTNDANKSRILSDLNDDSVIANLKVFDLLASRMKYWNSIKPGKYTIQKGDNLLSILRRLKNGRQTPVNLTIIKVRTAAQLARLAARRLEFDSASAMHFFDDSSFLAKFQLDTATFMTAVIPDTYSFFWNTTPEKVFEKLYQESQRFWNEDRRSKAEKLGLSPHDVYTMASIIDEETNAPSDKPKIASVYLNRLRLGMPLQADPTIKFAMQNFGLKRIYYKYLDAESPYNTYRNKGLPPGPICSPSKETIDAVLNAPETDYLYFVANKDFSNTHIFTSNYKDHMKYAREYQQALNRQDSIRKGLLKE